MVELKYIGTHQPKGMIVDVDEMVAKELLEGLEYEQISKISIPKVNTSKIIKEEVKPDDSKRITNRY